MRLRRTAACLHTSTCEQLLQSAYMPIESIPLRKTPGHVTLFPDSTTDNRGSDSDEHTLSSPIHVSNLSSRQLSRNSSPFAEIPRSQSAHQDSSLAEPDSPEDFEFDDWDEQDVAMPSDLRPELEREHGGRAHSPLLGHKADEGEPGAPSLSRRSTFHERDPETQAKLETRKRYTYAAIFLALSLVSFTVQTETAVYIQHELKWEKPYCML